MNMLNSLIIEGTLAPMSLCKESFRLVTTKMYKIADGTEDIERFSFTVIAHGRIMETVEKQWGDNRGIRVVGTLVRRDNAVRILAEYIEFKPKRAENESAVDAD